MRLYDCRIYCFGYSDASVNKSDWTTASVRQFGRAKLQGWSARHAAAEAYVMECGWLRSVFMERLGGPETVVDFEHNAVRVGQALKKGVCWKGPCYYFDNGVEIFFFVITPLNQQRSLLEMQRAMVRFICSN